MGETGENYWVPNYSSLQVGITLFLYKVNVKKTSQFKTQCKGDISDASKTAKITEFDPVTCITPDAPLQDELLCITYSICSLLFYATFMPL